jgi:large subunit ribosomal protein L21
MAGTAVFLWNFNMFAVIKTGGKQYKVAAGDVLEVELLAGEAGDKIEFDQVLAVGAGKDLKVGQAVGAAKVKAEVIGRTRGPKLIVFKKRRRQNSRRKNGHRQSYTAVKILEIAA